MNGSRRTAVVAALGATVLLGAPVVLAFFSGGYFAEPRIIAGLVIWLGVLALAVAGPAPLPRSGAGWTALSGLALITVWSAVSYAWAPEAEATTTNVSRLVVYTGALLLGLGTLRLPAARRLVEPTLAAGATIVIGYGLSQRVLPGLIALAHSKEANGRLEQPITYWNAEGVLAAVGLVLCARLAGDVTRPRLVRALAGAAAPVLGAGLYETFSRGAIAAAVVGLIVLVALLPRRNVLAGAGLTLAGAVLGALAAGLLPATSRLTSSLGTREREGAILLAVLVVLAAAGAALARVPRADTPLRGQRRLPLLAAGVVVLTLAGLVAGGLRERPSAAELGRAGAQRLTSVSSNRYDYWRVAARAFRRHPLDGLGSGGFRVAWLRERTIPEAVLETHSLELEMAAELGLVGLLAFAALVGGTAAAARRALVRDRAAVVGAAAAATAWLLHASIDWDWQMPAVALPVLGLAALLVVAGEGDAPDAAPAELRAGTSASARSRRDAEPAAAPSTAS